MGEEQKIEIDSARNEELDEVLALMCEAFEMPYEAARPIYYGDPYLDPANKRVLRRDGRIVSCMTLVETSCWIGRSVVPLAGVAGLATRAEHRNRGYAGRLLADAVRTLDARGYALAALLPYSRDYYRKFGWETGGHVLHVEGLLSALPTFPASARLRAADYNDIPALSSLYNTHAKYRALYCLRDAKRWRCLLDHTRRALVYAPAMGRIEGYLLHDYRLGRALTGDLNGGFSPTLRIQELFADTPAARRALLGYLAEQTDVDRFEYDTNLEDLQTSGLMGASGSMGSLRIEQRPAFMVRIINFARLLHSLCSNWNGFRGRIGLTLRDDLDPRSETVVVTGNGHTAAQIEISGQSEGALPADRMEGELRAWSRIVIGEISGDDACALGLLQPSSPEACELVSRLFPYRAPFLPVPDHF